MECGDDGRALECRAIEQPHKTGSTPLGDGAYGADLQQLPQGTGGEAGAADDIAIGEPAVLVGPQSLIEGDHAIG